VRGLFVPMPGPFGASHGFIRTGLGTNLFSLFDPSCVHAITAKSGENSCVQYFTSFTLLSPNSRSLVFTRNLENLPPHATMTIILPSISRALNFRAHIYVGVVLGNLSKKGKSKIPCSSMSLQSQDLFLRQERYKVIRNYAAHSLEFSGEALPTATPVLSGQFWHMVSAKLSSESSFVDCWAVWHDLFPL
jgi:hypothetical protein